MVSYHYTNIQIKLRQNCRANKTKYHSCHVKDYVISLTLDCCFQFERGAGCFGPVSLPFTMPAQLRARWRPHFSSIFLSPQKQHSLLSLMQMHYFYTKPASISCSLDHDNERTSPQHQCCRNPNAPKWMEKRQCCGIAHFQMIQKRDMFLTSLFKWHFKLCSSHWESPRETQSSAGETWSWPMLSSMWLPDHHVLCSRSVQPCVLESTPPSVASLLLIHSY